MEKDFGDKAAAEIYFECVSKIAADRGCVVEVKPPREKLFPPEYTACVKKWVVEIEGEEKDLALIILCCEPISSG